MKKKIGKLVCITLSLMIIAVSTVYARELPVKSVAEVSNSERELEPRSRYLASAISEITNEGEGVLGIYADFVSYKLMGSP